jgi:hypothetical protein
MQPAGRRGRPVNPATIYRWIAEGVKLPSGEVVRLEAYRMGSRWLTTVEALERFAERQTPRFDADPAPAPRTPASRRRAAENAARELERIGI